MDFITPCVFYSPPASDLRFFFPSLFSPQFLVPGFFSVSFFILGHSRISNPGLLVYVIISLCASLCAIPLHHRSWLKVTHQLLYFISLFYGNYQKFK